MVNSAADKIGTREAISALLPAMRGAKKKIGFTSGVFDLLHAGHAAYLEEARKHCDVLIVAVNSDESVRALKGELRPIVPEAQRAELVAALAAADHVFIFSDENNNKNIEVLRPDVYIKAGDYEKSQLSSAPQVEAYGGKVVLVRMRQGLSSSAIIDRIANRFIAGKTSAFPDAAHIPSPAVFVDRDGTINTHIEYLHEPERFEVIPGALEGLQRLQAAGYRIVVITNQPGIGLGYFTKEDFYRVTRELLSAATARGLTIDKVYFCPHSKADGCACRKPGTGMIERARTELNVILEESYVIGDMTSDIQTALNAGCKSILVQTGRAGDDKLYSAVPAHVAADLGAAADYILSENAELLKEKNSAAPPAPAAQAGKPDAVTTNLEAIGKVTAKLGHDFNNLFGSIRGCADIIKIKLDKLFPDENPVARHLQIIDRSLAKAISITATLRSFVRPGPVQANPVRLRDSLDMLIELLNGANVAPFDVVLNCETDPWIAINQYQVVQMLMALCLNAIEAMSSAEERYLLLNVATLTVDRSLGLELVPGRYAHLAIVDHGVGMSREMLNRAFEPFFSTKQTGIGSGLGLSLAMAREVMHKHNGELSIASIRECGTVVHLYFPLVEMK